MYGGWLHLPDHLHALAIFANPWVIGASLVGLVAEFFADKVAWLDSLWDSVHTAIRPIGGALLALAIVDPQDTGWQVVAFLLGGGAAFLGHSAKAGARAVVNVSPEPYSNVAVSAGEDIATGTMVVAALANPVAAVIVLITGLGFSVGLLLLMRRLLRRIMPVRADQPTPT
jgi:hypothetical protein